MASTFMLGAQVFIEPGQGKERVENWFRLLEQHGMTTSRIRLFEDHLKDNGHWDYDIYDFAFDMAAKYNIKLLVTLFPSDNSLGGFKFPRDEKHLSEIESYITHVVKHFKDHPALDCWVLQNEPGVEDRSKEDSVWSKYQSKSSSDKNEHLTGTSGNWTSMDWEMYFRDYTTWYLNWIADIVKKYDKKNMTHVNNHQLFTNLPQYNFKKWMPFLSTLGVSIHASWHLSFFKRSQYTMAIAAHCEIIKHASFPKPYWITELQGGNNIFSGFNPMSINAKDIAQWVWTGIMSNAERIIFWTLNPRGKGDETGEWNMLTYQDEPTDRLLVSKKIVSIVSHHSDFFRHATPLEPVVTLLYSIESMIALEKTMSNGFKDTYKGRKQGAHILSVLAYYETLMELGIPCEIKNIDEFNWSESNEGHTILLANAVAIASDVIISLYNFVENGNNLIMTGMTGFYDENMQNVYQKKSPFRELTGADLKGFEFIGELGEININDSKLPVHMLIGELTNYTASVISQTNGKITGVRNTYGDGHVTWIPSLVGLGSWQNTNEGLAGFLLNELSHKLDTLPFHLEKYTPGILIKTSRYKNEYTSMIINCNNYKIAIPFRGNSVRISSIWFGEASYIGNKIVIDANDTAIIRWLNE